MKRLILFIIVVVLMLSCQKEKHFAGPNFYQDDFEDYGQTDELIIEDDELWSFTQLTNVENEISLDTTRRHQGQQSLHFYARQSSTDQLSKCSLAKQFMAFWEGETVRMSAWYYLEGEASLQWLFLMDIEEQTAIGAGPGMRLALVENKLRVEYKFFEDDITQTIGEEVAFPRNQWVELVWEIELSRKKEGTVRLWQDGQLIINSNNQVTLPTDFLYSQQGTKGMYSSFEIGITANTHDSDLNLWIDDVKIEKAD